MTDDTATAADEEDSAYLDKVRREIDEEVRRQESGGGLPAELRAQVGRALLAVHPDRHPRRPFHRRSQAGGPFGVLRRAGPVRVETPSLRDSPSGCSGTRRRGSSTMWCGSSTTSRPRSCGSCTCSTKGSVRSSARSTCSSCPRCPTRTRSRPEPMPRRSATCSKRSCLIPGAPTGRVLHAECGDGSLIEALADADLDVYGIDPGSAAADRAAEKGLDVRARRRARASCVGRGRASSRGSFCPGASTG